MKTLLSLFLILSATLTFAVSNDRVEQLVREDIRDGKVIRGKTYVDELKRSSCDSKKCTFNYSYVTSGCSPYGDYCFDLECKGVITFDKIEIKTQLTDEQCFDL